MKGIVLAGGKGTRLTPITKSTCKQLLPVYDKPMIYYPLSILIQAGISQILLISTPEDQERFIQLLGNGSQWGITIEYAIQQEPKGIAQGIQIAEDFIGHDPVALILGDNLFYGQGLKETLQRARKNLQGATVFGYEVGNPSRYGVLEFSDRGEVQAILEKPELPPSRYAVTGLYFYDNQVVEMARYLTPSARGELEITDLNNAYLNKGELNCELLDRGFAWLDTGTPDALQKAAQYVQTIQERQGIKIGCIEEAAFEMGWIGEKELKTLADSLAPSDYANYLFALLCHLPTPLPT